MFIIAAGKAAVQENCLIWSASRIKNMILGDRLDHRNPLGCIQLKEAVFFISFLFGGILWCLCFLLLLLLYRRYKKQNYFKDREV